MLIYEMKHIPTGKVYIGALKDDTRFDVYNTSSKIVNPMMTACPAEWERCILLNKFSPIVTWAEVVLLEQSIIEATAKSIGWDRMWNGGVWKGSARLPRWIGAKQSEETKLKISLANKGRKRNEISKEKMRQSQLGKTQSEETKLKRSIALSGKSLSIEHREKVRLARLGTTRSAETKEKIRLERLNRPKECYAKGWETRRKNRNS